MKKTFAILLLALAGCGTVSDLAGAPLVELDGPAPHVFGGLRADVELAGRLPCARDPLLSCAAFFDLPLSAALDVVLLPVTLPVRCCRKIGPDIPLSAVLDVDRLPILLLRSGL